MADLTRNVFVGLASIPAREESLERVVAAVLPQCGKLGVYLNNYEQIPPFLNHPKIVVARSQDHGDLKDNGKFFFLQTSELRYYASVDDDINYPDDYIKKLLELQPRTRGIVGVHASYYPKEINSLLDERVVVHFRQEFDFLLPTTLVGTGTSLIDQGIAQVKFSEFGAPGMADVWLAVAAKKRGVTLWTVPREAGWLTAIPQPPSEEALDLYTQGKIDDSAQVSALKAAGIRGSIPGFLESIVRVPAIASAMSVSEVDYLWGLSRKLKIETLRKQDRNLYDFALLKHKDFSSKRDGLIAVEPYLETYATWLVELLSRDEGSLIRDEWIQNYRKFLQVEPNANLPIWAQRDASFWSKADEVVKSA